MPGGESSAEITKTQPKTLETSGAQANEANKTAPTEAVLPPTKDAALAAKDQNAIDKARSELAKIDEEPKDSLDSKTSNSTTPGASPEVKALIPTQTDKEFLSRVVADLDSHEKVIKSIGMDPKYQQILGELQAEAQKSGNIDIQTLKANAITRIYKEMHEQKNELTSAEQEKANREILKDGFFEHPMAMFKLANKGAELIKSRTVEATLQKNSLITQDQKASALNLVNKCKIEYGLMLKKMNLPKNSEIDDLLKKAPDNPELLKLMTEEGKKSAKNFILQILGLFAFSIGNEIRKALGAELPMEQQA